MSNSSIWLIGRNQSGDTILGYSGPESDGNEVALRIPQSSCITEASPSDCLMSYAGHSFGGCLTTLQRCSRCILQPSFLSQLGWMVLILVFRFVIFYVSSKSDWNKFNALHRIYFDDTSSLKSFWSLCNVLYMVLWAQSAETVKYILCISAECSRYDPKLARLQS